MLRRPRRIIKFCFVELKLLKINFITLKIFKIMFYVCILGLICTLAWCCWSIGSQQNKINEYEQILAKHNQKFDDLGKPSLKFLYIFHSLVFLF